MSGNCLVVIYIMVSRDCNDIEVNIKFGFSSGMKQILLSLKYSTTKQNVFEILWNQVLMQVIFHTKVSRRF